MMMGIKIFPIKLSKDLNIVPSKLSKFWKPVSRKLHPASSTQNPWFGAQFLSLDARGSILPSIFHFLRALKCKKKPSFFWKFHQSLFWQNLIAKKLYIVWLRYRASQTFPLKVTLPLFKNIEYNFSKLSFLLFLPRKILILLLFLRSILITVLLSWWAGTLHFDASSPGCSHRIRAFCFP